MQQTVETTYSVYQLIQLAVERKLPFAGYKLPGSEMVTALVQKNREVEVINDFSQLNGKGGFLIAPFTNDFKDKTYVIRPDKVCRNVVTEKDFDALNISGELLLNSEIQHAPEETEKQEYLNQVQQTIDLIKRHEYSKVVLSRVKVIDGGYLTQVGNIFELLCSSYPNAFVYAFGFNNTFWIGATPEPLLCSRNDNLTTVSLASTRAYSVENTRIDSWNHKERVEQEYVTEYIEEILYKFGIKIYSRKGPYTKKAGELLHLRTDFNFSFSEVNNRLPDLIRAIHPTSAVCGMPMKKSLDYINQTEIHSREYYAGYLGPIGIDERVQLFVNLRCMKVLSKQVALFVGGGITSESNPVDEWEETEIKAATLLNILDQIR